MWIENDAELCQTCQITSLQKKVANDVGVKDDRQVRGGLGIRTIISKPREMVSKVGQNLKAGIDNVKGLGKDYLDNVQKEMPKLENAQKAIKSIEETNDAKENRFRNKYPKEYRTDDGHYVRSLGERTIDNWLYLNEIAHEYEKCIIRPNGRWIYPDFFLPYDTEGNYVGPLAKGIYIEYWGRENDRDYDTRKGEKMAFYTAEKFELIPLKPEHLKDINKLLKPEFAKYFKQFKD